MDTTFTFKNHTEFNLKAHTFGSYEQPYTINTQNYTWCSLEIIEWIWVEKIKRIWHGLFAATSMFCTNENNRNHPSFSHNVSVSKFWDSCWFQPKNYKMKLFISLVWFRISNEIAIFHWILVKSLGNRFPKTWKINTNNSHFNSKDQMSEFAKFHWPFSTSPKVMKTDKLEQRSPKWLLELGRNVAICCIYIKAPKALPRIINNSSKFGTTYKCSFDIQMRMADQKGCMLWLNSL